MPSLRDRFNRALSQAHQRLYRRTGGRWGGHMRKAPVLVLTTRGRKSGQPRSVPVIYLEDGGRWLLVASNGGQDYDPAWYRNLLDHPEAEIRVGNEDIAVTAHDATDEERAAAWPKLVALYPGYEGYAKRTTRRLPVVVLTRR